MPTFKIDYPSGKDTYVETCDAKSIEEFVNRHFGSADWRGAGAKVSMLDEEGNEIKAGEATQKDDEDEEE